MLLEVPLRHGLPDRPARLPLVVEAAVTLCLYCAEELEYDDDLWCHGCEELEEPDPTA